MGQRKRKRAKRRKRTGQSPSGETPQRLSPQFRFEPGSYGGEGRFVPSIACLKQIAPRRWDYHFVLVRPDQIHTEEKKAVSQAKRDLDAAFSQKQRAGSDQAVAESLRAKGYLSVTGFKIAPE